MRALLTIIIAALLFAACNNPSGSTTASSNAKDVIGCYRPQTDDKAWYSSGKKAPLLEGLDGLNFRISTSNEEAQRYFNQGLMLAYGFNHAEAARSFYQATKLDSNCAMAYWGFAYVLGPNYNAGMESDNFERAYQAAQKANSLKENSSVMEKALIDALQFRYIANATPDRADLDIAYSKAMKKVYDQFPQDPDVGALYAESMMDLHPWDLYDKGTKAPKTWTGDILAVLKHLMELNPEHPGAHHFYIHALEASAHPELALPSAQKLEKLVPGAGHLVHMASHIYINTGDYHEGSLANIKAIEVDSIYTTACHAQGAYPLSYYPHNYHFLAATATLEGNSKWAWEASKNLHRIIEPDVMRMPGWGTLQHYYTIPYYVAVKLNYWDSILTIPAPSKDLVYPNAVWQYARGMAFIGLQKMDQAQLALDTLNQLAKDSILQEITVWGINTTSDLAQIARRVLQASIYINETKYAQAVTLLNEAIKIEDALNYNEPPDWFFSVRHYLGALLLKMGNPKAAEEVYRKDLTILRKNGWALHGLHQALLAQQKNKEAVEVQQQLKTAWAYADIQL